MNIHTYGYARVSSKDQNEARQMSAMAAHQIPQTHIFMDKQSGKDFNRPQYKRLLRKLKKGDLLIVEGEDLCTLITCSPYGINSHRMLVRGHRIATEAVKVVRRVTADAVQIEPVIVAPFVAAPMLLILLIALLIPKPKKRKENR